MNDANPVNVDIIENIKKKYNQNYDKAIEYRKRLQKELEEECVKSGGHYFWDWIRDPVYSIGGYTIYTHRRECRACSKRETKTEPEDD